MAAAAARGEGLLFVSTLNGVGGEGQKVEGGVNAHCGYSCVQQLEQDPAFCKHLLSVGKQGSAR